MCFEIVTCFKPIWKIDYIFTHTCFLTKKAMLHLNFMKNNESLFCTNDTHSLRQTELDYGSNLINSTTISEA